MYYTDVTLVFFGEIILDKFDGNFGKKPIDDEIKDFEWDKPGYKTNEEEVELVKRGYVLDEEDIGELNCNEDEESDDEDDFEPVDDDLDEDEKEVEDDPYDEGDEDEYGEELPAEPVKRGRGRPKMTDEEKEEFRRRRGGQSGNQNSSLENRQKRTLEKAVTPFLEDIKNPARKRKFILFLSKVRSKELNLDELEAILYMMVSEEQRKPAKSRDKKIVTEAIGQIRQLTEVKRKQEESTMAVMRDTKIVDMFQQFARILTAHINDPQLLASIVQEMRIAMNSTIDVRNLSKTVDTTIKALEKENPKSILD
jgi:hypothetical protein